MRSAALAIAICTLASLLAYGGPAMAGDSTLDQNAKAIGREVGGAARKVGQEAKKVGKAIGHAAKDGAQAVKKGSKEFARAVKGQTTQSERAD
jgi:hypothetical protein